MGLGAVSYGIQIENRPKRIVVTDIDDAKIERAREVIPEAKAAENGVELLYVNTAKMADPVEELKAITGGKGYDDVFVYIPNRAVAEMGDKLLAFDGCMNFFAGPTDNQFKAEINLYNCHYTSTHILGTTGGNNDDLIEANELAAKGKIEPAVMEFFHISGKCSGKSIATASILLGIMILPTIIGVAESAINAVPDSYYEGSLALGASHERSVFFATLPAAKSGILAGVILGVGRAIGETMAVIMVAGNQPRI